MAKRREIRNSTAEFLIFQFETGELKKEATISKIETVQQEGSREVKRRQKGCFQCSKKKKKS